MRRSQFALAPASYAGYVTFDFIKRWNLKLCGSRQYPHPPKGGSLEFQGGGGVVKFFQEKYEVNLEFPVGRVEGGGGLFETKTKTVGAPMGIDFHFLWNNAFSCHEHGAKKKDTSQHSSLYEPCSDARSTELNKLFNFFLFEDMFWY